MMPGYDVDGLLEVFESIAAGGVWVAPPPSSADRGGALHRARLTGGGPLVCSLV